MSTPGATELLIILLILVVLFGAKKLPELARGTGRALRIFKSETKGLADDDDDDETTSAAPTSTSQAQIAPTTVHPAQPVQPAQPLPPTHVEK